MFGKLTVTFALSLSLSACISDLEPGEELEVEAIDQAINGEDHAALPWMFEQAVDLRRSPHFLSKHYCTGTLISDRHVLTAAHCDPRVGDFVRFYEVAANSSSANGRTVTMVQVRPGVTPDDLDDTTGNHADIAVLTLDARVTESVPATLAWAYPGPDDTGVKVGGGRHDGDDNNAAELRYVLDDTYSDEVTNGEIFTVHHRTDKGDSGGPFYDNARVLGVRTGAKLIWGAMRGWYTSVPTYLDWILGRIGWTWSRGAIVTGFRTGDVLAVLPGRTQRECAYACEHTTACVAFNHLDALLDQCQLLSSDTTFTPLSGWRTGAK